MLKQKLCFSHFATEYSLEYSKTNLLLYSRSSQNGQKLFYLF